MLASGPAEKGNRRGGADLPPQFFCVLTDRDHLKLRPPSAPPEAPRVHEPIWRYVEGQEHWLTSLVYLKNLRRAPGRFFFDCGAWSYKFEERPRWTPEQCVELYAPVVRPGDLVCAPDHMVLVKHSQEVERDRVSTTLQYAREFLQRCPAEWRPVAVNHGHDVATRVRMTREFLDMGYRAIAIGSVAIRARFPAFITSVLDEMAALRQEEPFHVHVLGVSAPSWYPTFTYYSVDSFDGSSMFFGALQAAQYYWHDPSTPGRLLKYDSRTSSDEEIPECSCPACAVLRIQDPPIDTRKMGTNENNMGRAVHNINQYLSALRSVAAATTACPPAAPPRQLSFI
jgi:hypothetical protein